MKNFDVENSPLTYLKGVGPKRAEILEKEGILSVSDLVTYFPRDYIDRAAMASIKQIYSHLQKQDVLKNIDDGNIPASGEVTIVVKVKAKGERSFGRNRKMLSLTISDDSSSVAKIVFWSRIQYFDKVYSVGQTLAVSGKPEINKYGDLIFNHPEIDIVSPEDEESYLKGKILPKYRITENMAKAGINLRVMRKIMRSALDSGQFKIKDTLSEKIAFKFSFPDVLTTINNLHFPDNRDLLQASQFRVKFDEMFYFQLFLELRKNNIRISDKAPVAVEKSPLARNLYSQLPFKLTPDQKKVLAEIATDIRSSNPMNRLLQGDVGSGKTIVAVFAMLMMIDSGYQVAFMAPTEILAEQHFHTFKKFMNDLEIETVLLTGSLKKKVKEEIYEKIKSGDAKVIIGTHAMIQESVEYNKLGLIVIDEQHRFGVMQRGDLIKSGKASLGKDKVPHILVMSATPIPRTLSMTMYGDLDVSIIRTKPSNRKPIITKVEFDSNRQEVYNFIRQEITRGQQAFIVFPLVEKSEKLDLKAAVEQFEIIDNEVFPNLSCGLLHGQMKWNDKETIMHEFKDGKYQILIATTVIEVGIDIPNANIMLIENAERFGLSQLHQLRGRVGRGAEQSYCFLMTKEHFKFHINSKKKEEDKTAAIVRLKTMQDTDDGFKIANVDMRLRGPGDLMGTRQAGMPDFKYVDLVNDEKIIAVTKEEARHLVENDPHLRNPENQVIRDTYMKYSKKISESFEIA